MKWLPAALPFAVLCACAGADDIDAPADPMIVLDSVTALDPADAPDVPGAAPVVAVRGDGSEYVVAASTEPAELLRFDAGGAYVGSFARAGRGPGELSHVAGLVFDGTDTLWVFNENRVDLWGPGYEFVRSIPIGSGVSRSADVARGEAGRVLLSTRSHDGAGWSYYAIDRAGEMNLLGTEPMDGSEDQGGTRSIAAAGPDRYWVGNWDVFDIRMLGEGQDTIVRIDAPPPWWNAGDRSAETETIMDPTPSILDVATGPDGELWMIIGIPNPDPAVMERMMAGDRTAIREIADFEILVYDGEGRQLANQRFDYLQLRFLSDGLAYTTEQDDRYGWRTVIWRYSLGS